MKKYYTEKNGVRLEHTWEELIQEALDNGMPNSDFKSTSESARYLRSKDFKVGEILK